MSSGKTPGGATGGRIEPGLTIRRRNHFDLCAIYTLYKAPLISPEGKESPQNRNIRYNQFDQQF
jgi:hypothetical protein